MNVGKFKFVEIFNNTTGKTSATKFIGVISSIVCIFLLVVLVGFYFHRTEESAVVLQMIDKVIMFFGVSSGLMGVKSISSAVSTRTNINIKDNESDGDADE